MKHIGGLVRQEQSYHSMVPIFGCQRQRGAVIFIVGVDINVTTSDEGR
jgi:hypothetical protein